MSPITPSRSETKTPSLNLCCITVKRYHDPGDSCKKTKQNKAKQNNNNNNNNNNNQTCNWCLLQFHKFSPLSTWWEAGSTQIDIERESSTSDLQVAGGKNTTGSLLLMF